MFKIIAILLAMTSNCIAESNLVGTYDLNVEIGTQQYKDILQLKKNNTTTTKVTGYFCVINAFRAKENGGE